MDFVLIDNSKITNYSERVSRIVEGVGQLQDRMNAVLQNVLGGDYSNYVAPAARADEYMESFDDSAKHEQDRELTNNDAFITKVDESFTQEDDSVDLSDGEYEDVMNYVDDYVDGFDLESDLDVESEIDNTPYVDNFDQSQTGAAIDMSSNDSIEEGDDLDIDLDAMLDGISFDVDEIEL